MRIRRSFAGLNRGDYMPKSKVKFISLEPGIEADLEIKANGKIAEFRKTSRIIKEEIFGIIADSSIFLQYPIEDDEFCGFVSSKKGRLFTFVNSYITFENQIFAAAHELYHIWFDKDIMTQGELLKNDVINPCEKIALPLKEKMANRFAAMFLVPKNVLKDEIEQMGIKKEELELNHIVKLMDTFSVSYKTMVRRFYEIDFISDDECLKWLDIPDNGEHSPVRIAQKRLQLGEEQQRRTKIIRFSGLADKAVTAFEQNKIDEEKLAYLLSLMRKTPEEFNILTRAEKEKEILELLENDM